MKRCVLFIFLMTLILNFELISQENSSENSDSISDEVNSSVVVENESVNYDLIKTPSIGNYLIALLGTELSNLALFSYNHFVAKADYAMISLDSIKNNFQTGWVWDQDEFAVNQIGHPYQGSFYFISARANNIPFEQALLFSVLGSVSWEYIAETELPSYNDLICTTVGSAALGEMLHRLYLEAANVNGFISFVVSPMDFIMNIPKHNVSKQFQSNINKMNFNLGAGMIHATVDFPEEDGRSHDMVYNPISINGGLEIGYGNPYKASFWDPYSSFDLQFNFEFSKNYYSGAIFSEGLLSNFKTFYGENTKTLLGLVYDFDVLYNFYQNYTDYGLCFSNKLNHSKNGWNYNHSFSIGAMFFGGTDFYYLNTGVIEVPGEGEHRVYDFSVGWMQKISIDFSNYYFGNFHFNGIISFMNTIENTVPEKGSNGHNIATLMTMSYDHCIGHSKYALGITASWYAKRGIYDIVNNVIESIYTAGIYAKKIW